MEWSLFAVLVDGHRVVDFLKADTEKAVEEIKEIIDNQLGTIAEVLER